MPEFEKLFDVPRDHDLEEVRSKSRAGVITGIYWTHDQYDPFGQFVQNKMFGADLAIRASTKRSIWQRLTHFST